VAVEAVWKEDVPLSISPGPTSTDCRLLELYGILFVSPSKSAVLKLLNLLSGFKCSFDCFRKRGEWPQELKLLSQFT
jgi:hypothetical protein